MTCRDEILEAVKFIITKKCRNEFTISEVMGYMVAKGTEYAPSTIRTHITSKCCKDAPQNHGTKYDDFERIGKGLYSLIY